MKWFRLFARAEIGAVLLTGFLLLLHHHDFIGSINTNYLGNGGDGLKNYYTIDYHLRYDSTFSRFEGMNYPYGEQIVFTDNQPLLVNTLKAIKPLFDTSDYVVGIVNSLMLLSIVLGAFFLSRLFRAFQVPEWAAAIAAAGIMLLSPQVFRMGAHYALAHMWVLPGYLWLLYRYSKEPSTGRALAIGGLVLGASLFHLYYLALTLFLSGFYVLIGFFYRSERQRFLSRILHLLLMVILPYVLIKIWMGLTDPVIDRPATPFGFLRFLSSPEGIFLPITSPYRGLLRLVFDPAKLEYEGMAYVGGWGILGILTGLILVILWTIRTGWKRLFAPFATAFQNRLWWASVLVLLISFGIPFLWNIKTEDWQFQFRELIRYLGPLKQFRSLGRLAWVFYYGLNVLLILGWSQFLHRRVKRKALRVLLLVLPLLILHMDAWVKQDFILNKTYSMPELVNRDNLPADHWTKRIDVGRYQAILPLPYFHVGSDLFKPPPGEGNQQAAFVASSLTGLPLVAVQMSRTSISQTLTNLAVVMEPMLPCEYVESLPDERPILIIADRNKKVYRGQRALVHVSRFLFEQDGFIYYELDPANINERIPVQQELVQQAIDTLNWTPKNGFELSDSLAPMIYMDFEDWQAPYAYRGAGAFHSDVSEERILLEFDVTGWEPGKLRFSGWARVRGDGLPSVQMAAKQYNEAGHELGFYMQYRFGDMLHATDGDWGLFEQTFMLSPEAHHMRFYFRRNLVAPSEITIDDFLLVPDEVQVLKRGSEKFFWNNRWYQQP